MNRKTPIINIITYGLPYKLANQIYKEHAERLKEAKYIIDLPNKYQALKKDFKTVDILLALSIFHKRIISCLDGADKFYGTITRISDARTIVMGNYKFTGAEHNKILGLLINYRQIAEKFSIPKDLMNYDLTKDFLAKLLTLKNDLNVKTTSKTKGDFTDENKTGNNNDIPF